jgi:tetratricopeptide (TPR) repeat protein
MVGYRALGSTLFTLGEFVRARECLEQSVALGQRTTAEKSSLSFAVDPAMAAQIMLAWDFWILGYPEQARRNVLAALGRATERSDPYGVAFAHYVTSAIHLLRGEPRESLMHAERSLELSKEHRINLYALYSRFGRGCALAEMGQKEIALVEIREGLEQARRSNLGYMRGFMLGWLATVQAQVRDPATALATIDEALKLVNDVAGRAWEAELRRLRGEILLRAQPDAWDDAERSYGEAIAIARNQRARSLELRAAVSFARLLRERGRNDEARRPLASVFGWFSEGMDTADLKEAQALLDELKAG